jgi:nicotinate-nucleotide adenylyltransferase
MTVRRAILGGTFDPIHNGHLILAQEVLWRLGVEGVWFIPAGLPWMKREVPLSDKEHRRKMVEIAIADNPAFHLSTVELDRPGDTFTIDTLDELRAGEMADGEFMLVIGADTLRSLHLWKEPKRMLEMAQLVVAMRPGSQELDLRELEAIGVLANQRVTTVEMPLIDISGTELRRRVRASEPVRYLVPEGVSDYIEQNGLYQR